MYSLDEFIRAYDKDHTVRKAIAACLTENMTKEVAIETLANDLQRRLYRYIDYDENLSIDDGSNIARAFTKEIERILAEYFVEEKNQEGMEYV